MKKTTLGLIAAALFAASVAQAADNQYQHIRNATAKIEYAGKTFLVDPYLAEKDRYLPPNAQKRNPTVEMNQSIEEVLKGVDAVIVTHTHADHWDEVAQQRVPKNLPIFVQNAGDARLIRSQGFTDVRVVGKDTPFEGVTLTRTRGQHGTDAMYANQKVAEMVGDAMGVVMKAEGNPTVYLVGDTIWNHEVEYSFNTYKPDFVVLNAGCAKLPNFEGSPIMCQDDVEKAHTIAPQAKILTVHMDALPQTSISSDQMKAFVEKQQLNRVTVPKNGDVIKF
ncbi:MULTISPECIES: MBL fold metallo-hydrolase [unclassified Mannheimia]|uniref:MBL fold metallo-hydrolase n=1 Tax=unclassified Mannheimia TaxID=2645054 RepID=UPI00359E0D0A